jgi:hypothetical protein
MCMSCACACLIYIFQLELRDQGSGDNAVRCRWKFAPAGQRRAPPPKKRHPVYPQRFNLFESTPRNAPRLPIQTNNHATSEPHTHVMSYNENKFPFMKKRPYKKNILGTPHSSRATPIYILTRRRGADTAHTQMGRPTYEAPTREYTHKHTQTQTNTQLGPTKYGADSRRGGALLIRGGSLATTPSKLRICVIESGSQLVGR